MSKLKVSIITPVKNCERSLERTIESVLSQGYEDIEYIIVDGNSTDGSHEIIKKYRSRIKLICGNDKSIADAMNKGLKEATGSLIGVLNADDYYLKDAVKKAVRMHHEYPESIIHGDMLINDQIGRSYVARAPAFPNFKKGQVINHPATFIPASIVKQFGVYDPIFQIVGDWELFLRYQQAGVCFKALNSTLTCYEIGGISSRKPEIVFAEMHDVRRQYKLYKNLDFRFLRDKMLLLLFGKYVITLSYKMRMIRYHVNNIIEIIVRKCCDNKSIRNDF
jgi:glycosyltransferase involved in cell wall biosynthesis